MPKQDPIVSELRRQLRETTNKRERRAIGLLLALYADNIGALCCLISEFPKSRLAYQAGKRLMEISSNDRHLALIANFLPALHPRVEQLLRSRMGRSEILRLYIGHAPALSTAAAKELMSRPGLSNADLRYIITWCPDLDTRYDAGDYLLVNPDFRDIILVHNELPEFRLDAMHEFLKLCSPGDLYAVLEEQHDPAYVQVNGQLLWKNPKDSRDVVVIRTMPPRPHGALKQPVGRSFLKFRPDRKRK